MLKKTITYKSFDDQEVTEDFYFNLSKAELIEMEVSRPGGLGAHLEQVAQSGDGQLIIQTFKDILKKSYGVRSEDGKRFIKTEEAWQEFASTEAYSEIFMQLVTDAAAAAEFVNGIVPKNLEAELAKIQTPDAPRPDILGGQPAEVATGPRQLTRAEVIGMDEHELKSGLAEGRFKI